MHATVAVCTYNGAKRIGPVIEALGKQSIRAGAWELLVIDNASTDETGKAAVRLIADELGGRGRVVCEPQPGLSYARARAAREAQGKIICFLDDDNIPAPDFITAAVRAFEERPKAGVIGGKVLPRWENPPTPLAQAVAPFALAICDRGDKAFCYKENLGPVGAGLCIRTQVLLNIYRDQIIVRSVIGRKGAGHGGGEDLVIAVRTWQLGYECWYVPSLNIEHLLPVSRMQKAYLLQLYQGIGRGQAATRRISDWRARTPLAWLIGIKDLGRWVMGCCRGPSPELRRTCPLIASDLHCLQQKQIWSRALQTLSWSQLNSQWTND